MLTFTSKPNHNRIALIGKMRSGKDTLAKYLKDDGYMRYAFGDEVKRNYHNIFGSKEQKDRAGYQWFGQAMREHEAGVWVRKLLEKMHEEKPAKVVVTDCRQPNEFQALKDRGYVMVRIDCDETTRIERMNLAGDTYTLKDLRHETEVALDDYPAHITISNNGTKAEMVESFNIQLKGISFFL